VQSGPEAPGSVFWHQLVYIMKIVEMNNQGLIPSFLMGAWSGSIHSDIAKTLERIFSNLEMRWAALTFSVIFAFLDFFVGVAHVFRWETSFVAFPTFNWLSLIVMTILALFAIGFFWWWTSDRPDSRDFKEAKEFGEALETPAGLCVIGDVERLAVLTQPEIQKRFTEVLRERARQIGEIEAPTLSNLPRINSMVERRMFFSNCHKIALRFGLAQEKWDFYFPKPAVATVLKEPIPAE